MIESNFNSELISLVGEEVSSKKFLLGVSGGIDSMCMAELFYRSSLHLQFAVAHVNFSLREIDCDIDMNLVSTWAQERKVQFFCKKADTRKYMQENSLSTQVAARELRYQWFNELIREHGYDYIVIAHNLNDNAETMFLNMLRGSGLKGISGIPARNGKIIRPLLNYTREQIEYFVNTRGVIYRDDLTNFESHYSRNKLRNIVFPEFQNINPSFLQTLHRNSYYLRQSSDILDELYLARRGQFMVEKQQCVSIDMNLLLSYSHPEYWLYRALNEYGFNSSQVEDIFISARSLGVGKMFYSPSVKLVVDRERLNIYPLKREETVKFVIRHPGRFYYKDKQITIKIYEKPKYFSPRTKFPGQTFLDAQKVTFPILCRSWHPADRFRPLGMKIGEKKLSDFFIDEKLDRHQKENVPIFISENRIVALLGMRPDERYKITKRTKMVMEVRLTNPQKQDE